MKILIIRITTDIANLNTYNLQEIGLAKALVRKGHTCDVAYFCGNEKDHYETLEFGDKKNKIRVLWIHGYCPFTTEGLYPSLKNYVDDYDIIQVGGYVGLTSVWLNRHVQNKVVNYQGAYYCKDNKGDNIKAFVYDHLLLPFSNKKNMVVYSKSKLSTQYMESKGIKNVTTVGVGLDLDNIVKRDESIYNHKFVKQLTDNKKNSKYLLYVGVLEERRNTKFLIKLFGAVHAEKPECKLVMVGKGNDEYVNECLALIDEMGLKDFVIYEKSLEQKYLKAVYEISDVFLLPSSYEIFGMVLLEAMYFGLPAFTTYNGGSSMLMNKDNGFVIDELDVEKWKTGVLSVLDDSALYDKISQNATKTIENGYTWDALADKVLEVYKKRLG